MLQLLSSEICSCIHWLWCMINGTFFPFSLFILFTAPRAAIRLAASNVIESESGCNGSGLWQNRNFRTNWEGHFGVQCVWYRVKALVRYVGVPEETYCSMAHFEGSRRGNWRRQEVNRLLSQPSEQLQQMSHRLCISFISLFNHLISTLIIFSR